MMCVIVLVRKILRSTVRLNVTGFLQLVIYTMLLAGAASATELDEQLRNGVESGDLAGLHGTIVELDQKRLAESYFDGEDQNWGEPLGLVEHGPDTLHDLRSVTKSIVGLLYGIALAENKVPAIDQPLYAQFPGYPDLQKQPGRRKILVEHALSMQMGIEWNEDLPYSDPKNSEIAMELAEDRYRYALEQKIMLEPGSEFTYSGGAVALIGKIIADGTGMSIDDYAKEKLFNPLGIDEFQWAAGKDNVPSAASGLRLKLNDLVAIGNMVAQNGRFNNKQVVPSTWIDELLTPRVSIDEYVQYGLLWYISGTPENVVVFGAGNGGQRLTIQPDHKLVVASYCGLYNDPNAWRTSFKVLREYAVPVAKKALAE